MRSTLLRLKAFVASLAGTSLFARSMRSSALTIMRVAGENVLRLVSNLILTRLLFPEAFGLMSIIAVIMTGLIMFTDVGTQSAVIQNPRGKEPNFLNTAWTIQVGRCTILWLVTCMLAMPVASFYNEPVLAQLLPVSGLNLLFLGFVSTRAYEANRNLLLGRLTTLSLASQVLGVIAMSVLAWLTHSVWALVIGSLVATLTKTVLSHLVLPGTRNRFFLEREALRSLIGFGKWIFVASIAGFIVNQGDRAILGKYITMDELGIYNIAYFMATVPLLFGSSLARTVIFPLYTLRNPAESAENRNKLSRARFLVSAILLAGTVVLALGGDWIVRVLYDVRYHDGGAMLILLAIATLPQLLILSYGESFLAAGHSGRFAFYMITRAVVQSACLILLIINFGLVAVPIALFVSTLVIYPLVAWMIRPYRAWDPLHDATIGLVGGALTVLTFIVHGDLLLPLFAPVLTAF